MDGCAPVTSSISSSNNVAQASGSNDSGGAPRSGPNKEDGKRKAQGEGRCKVDEDREEQKADRGRSGGRRRGDLDPALVRRGWEEEMNVLFEVLGMFEFGSLEERR